MPAYQHVVVVMSIVLGLAVTQLLRGMAQLYRSRQRVRTYWLHWSWAILLTIFSFLLWWTFWNYRSVTDWDFLRFVIYLSPTIVFYLLTSLTFPDPSDSVVDMRDYYFANRGGIFGTFALYGVLAGVTAIVVRGLPLLDPSNIFRVLLVALSIVAMRSTSERVHIVVLIFAASLMVAFTLLFQYRLS